MHDPMTVAWDIKSPIARKDGFGTYRDTLITIWHRDPCRDGTDDSCGWFKRARHGDKAVLAKIEKAFAFDWDTKHEHSGAVWFSGWFNPDTGMPILSVSATTLEMFRRAAYIHFGDWDKTERFMVRNLYRILSFAENQTDSLRDSIINRFGHQKRQDRIEHFAAVIYGFILRAEQKWWQHPRWHVHHWEFQVRPWQTLRRWMFDRCCKCGSRFAWGESPTTNNWDSPSPRLFRSVPGIYHSDCRNPGNSGAGAGGGMNPSLTVCRSEAKDD